MSSAACPPSGGAAPWLQAEGLTGSTPARRRGGVKGRRREDWRNDAGLREAASDSSRDRWLPLRSDIMFWFHFRVLFKKSDIRKSTTNTKFRIKTQNWVKSLWNESRTLYRLFADNQHERTVGTAGIKWSRSLWAFFSVFISLSVMLEKMSTCSTFWIIFWSAAPPLHQTVRKY